MMKFNFLVCLMLVSTFSIAQIKGNIKDTQNKTIPYVSIYIANTHLGTTSNTEGEFELNIRDLKGDFTIIFQSLGYKTQKVTVLQKELPKTINIILEEESFNLNEVVISSKDNPANDIIRKAIKNKDKNTKKTSKFSADFYSKGILKLKNMPKKFLGEEIGDFDGSLDSTRSGIIYLSETFSKIKFEKPKKLTENIIASKISGNDNGFSYNTAQGTSFDFYDNTVRVNLPMISPISSEAFQYYKYALEGTFYSIDNQLINKIKVTPKRDPEPVFEGYIYIVEDTWSIYAVDLTTKGYRANNEFLDFFRITQNFSYNTTDDIWSRNQQTISFEAGAFGIKFTGNFNHVFTNYEFVDSFDKKTFGRKLLSIDKESNKKDSIFWDSNRPIPLTDEEEKDYLKKDSIQKVRKSPAYLDSIDRKINRFKLRKILTGYTYQNSLKKERFTYDGLVKLLLFNTVQGWNMNTNFRYFKYTNEEETTYKQFGLRMQYGFADETWRPLFYYNQKFNNTNKANLSASIGNTVQQFNNNEPISPLVNSFFSLLLKNNFMKIYEKNFVSAGYYQELFNGLYISTSAEYAHRKPLFNQTDFSWTNRDKAYTSNNPLDLNNNNSAAFDSHQILLLNANLSIRFGQRYLDRPDGKFNIRNNNFPTLNLFYRKGFLSSQEQYNFDYLAASTFYDKTLSNKGTLGIALKAGTFFNNPDISFIDFRHFRDNQTRISTGKPNYDTFNLAPFYEFSTASNFLELHSEHNFNGYVMNKIPLLRALKSQLVVGYHLLTTADIRSYQEYTIGLDRLGFGKFKFFRVDYIRSYLNGVPTDGVVLGIKLLDVVQ